MGGILLPPSSSFWSSSSSSSSLSSSSERKKEASRFQKKKNHYHQINKRLTEQSKRTNEPTRRLQFYKHNNQSETAISISLKKDRWGQERERENGAPGRAVERERRESEFFFPVETLFFNLLFTPHPFCDNLFFALPVSFSPPPRGGGSVKKKMNNVFLVFFALSPLSSASFFISIRTQRLDFLFMTLIFKTAEKKKTKAPCGELMRMFLYSHWRSRGEKRQGKGEATAGRGVH